MTNDNSSNRRQSRMTKVVGIVLVVALFCSSRAPAAEAPGWTKRIQPDWSMVQTVPQGTRTTVLLHKDLAPREKRKVKGHFLSATAESITLVRPSGQPRTIDKEEVRRVLVLRPVADRFETGVGAAAGSLLGILAGRKSGDFAGSIVLLTCAFAGLGFLLAPKMKRIYNLPRDHQKGQKRDSQSVPDPKNS